MLTWLKKQIVGTAGKPQSPAEELYYALLEASRTPMFYLKYGVKDSFDGRFDILCLLVSLMMHRLRAEGDAAKAFSQELFDAMFTDIDLTLREQGAGDTGLGKRVRIMSEGFVGRLAAYSDALDANDKTALSHAIARNLSRAENVSETDSALATMSIHLSKQLAETDYKTIFAGGFNTQAWVHAQL